MVPMETIDIRPRPSSRSDRKDWYREALDLQAASGHGVAAFAEAIGVTPATLYLWKRRFAGQESAMAEPSGFLRVDVGGRRAAAGGAAPFRVSLLSGRTISVAVGFHAEELQRLVATLEAC